MPESLERFEIGVFRANRFVRIQRAANGGLDPSWLNLAFLGRPDFPSRCPKTLKNRYFGTSGLKIGAPQKCQIQPRRIQPPIRGPLTNRPDWPSKSQNDFAQRRMPKLQFWYPPLRFEFQDRIPEPLLSGEHRTGSPNKSTDQIGKKRSEKCPKIVCAQCPEGPRIEKNQSPEAILKKSSFQYGMNFSIENETFIPGPSLAAEKQGLGLKLSIENENFKPRMKNFKRE